MLDLLPERLPLLVVTFDGIRGRCLPCSAQHNILCWCEILDADAFQAFKETGNIFNKEVAARFEKEILSKGGTKDPLDMYIAFRGKEPGIDALLVNRGLK